MLKELIKIREKDGKQLVSARELYEFLGATERFNSWFERYCKYGFERNVDYTSVKTFAVVNNGAKKEIDDYAVTIDMAKELSMLQRTEKGKEARKYFIECEKELRNREQTPQDYLAALKALVASEEAKQKAIAEKNRLIHQNKLYTTSEIAKELGFRSAREFNQVLANKHIQYKQNGTWLLYSDYADKNLVSIKQEILENDKIIYHRKWTGTGRDFLLELLE